MYRIKRYFAKRWISSLTYEDLKAEADYKHSVQQFNNAFEQLSQSMIDNYYNAIQPDNSNQES